MMFGSRVEDGVIETVVEVITVHVSGVTENLNVGLSTCQYRRSINSLAFSS